MNNLIINNLQRWTPISVLIVIATVALAFVIVWDTIHSIPLPPYVVGLLSFILGGTGVSAAITHGNNLATSQSDATAKAVATAAAVTATNIISQPLIHNGGSHGS
jgi:hypothetical protein